MMTIGRNHHGPLRDYQTACDVCGVNWLRSELKPTEDGRLLCPDDSDGMTEAELNRERVATAGDTAGVVPATRR